VSSTGDAASTSDAGVAARAEAVGPLAGIRVVELGMWVAGPGAGGILADWGADVIKIEPPTGDPARTFGGMLGINDGTNPPFDLDNRSKRSIAIDLSTDAGRAIVHELLESADVFLTNIRLDALARVGLASGDVLAKHPGLVYGLVTGYGIEGDEANRRAFDIAAYWARSGIADALTPPGGDLPFQRGGMGDHSVAMTAAAMISAALVHKERTGEGQLVTTSLLRQGAYTIGFDVNVALMWGFNIQLGNRSTMRNPAMNNYTAGDGRRFWIVGLEVERHWPPLARAVGHPEWLTDERFSTAAGRGENAGELIGLLDEIFLTKPLEEWSAIFEGDDDFIWSPVNSVNDLIVDPQFFAAGGIITVPDEDGGSLMLATPADFHGTPAGPRFRPPRLAEHTRAILGELGRTDADIDILLADGAVL
jgi:crotonobetainyl-CoA:carnitine CoA-transferase CaiB-like acyl-CoA transferase